MFVKKLAGPQLPSFSWTHLPLLCSFQRVFSQPKRVVDLCAFHGIQLYRGKFSLQSDGANECLQILAAFATPRSRGFSTVRQPHNAGKTLQWDWKQLKNMFSFMPSEHALTRPGLVPLGHHTFPEFLEIPLPAAKEPKSLAAKFLVHDCHFKLSMSGWPSDAKRSLIILDIPPNQHIFLQRMWLEKGWKLFSLWVGILARYSFCFPVFLSHERPSFATLSKESQPSKCWRCFSLFFLHHFNQIWLHSTTFRCDSCINANGDVHDEHVLQVSWRPNDTREVPPSWFSGSHPPSWRMDLGPKWPMVSKPNSLGSWFSKVSHPTNWTMFNPF